MLRPLTTISCVILATVACRAADLIDLSVVTSRGYVTYTVPGDWTVLDMQTKAPKTSAVFQIKRNPAEASTSDSTNLSISTFEDNSPEATATFQNMAAKHRAEASARSKHGAWQLFTRQAPQGKTMYQVRYAFRDVVGAHVFVSCAWPLLPRNAPRYDADMQAAFIAVLDSVKGGLGPKPRTGGEVVRRPLDQ